MSFMCNDNLKIAYERSDEIIQNVKYPQDQAIGSDTILEYVRKTYCPVIELYSMSFENVQSCGVNMRNCGAMMRVDFDTTPKAATIILNSVMPGTFQRFSLMQQIGHLVTIPPDSRLDPNSFHISTQINYDLWRINEEELENDCYMLREQIANIFALRVLMPNKQFFRVMRELGNTQAVAAFFGLTEDAVISRMMIGA